jgi:hypothetical protein
LIALQSPELGDYQNLSGSFEDWVSRSKQARTRNEPEYADYCVRKAYFDSDDLAESFYAYCRDIVMASVGESANKLDRVAHLLMIEFLAGKGRPKSLKEARKRISLKYVHGSDRYKMLQAARYSLKSTIGAAGFATWRVAQDYVLTGESKLTVLFASENLSLAKRNVQWCKQIFEWSEDFIKLAGDHKGTHADKQRWSLTEGLTSQFRRDPIIAEPTIAPIGVTAGRHGFHFKLIIRDDLQAEASSATPQQIDKCHDFSRQLHNIGVKDGTLEMIDLCTRWHNDDVYVRMENLNEQLPTSQKTKILKIPCKSKKTGSINFPTIYTVSSLERDRKEMGPRMFANQMMLEAVADEDVAFKPGWVQYWTSEMLKHRRLDKYVTVDMAYREVDMTYRGHQTSKAPFTAILTVGIDEEWNYFLLDWFRERCSATTSVKEIYRQMEENKALRVLAQKFDRVHIEEAIDQYGFTINKRIPLEFIPYPSRQSKDDRIEKLVFIPWEQRKVFIKPDMTWLLNDECYDFPASRTKDGLDALANVMAFSNPKTKMTKAHQKPKEQIIEEQLLAGLDPYDDEADSWKSL